jgi:uncharacterized delta-60 repeat protein
MPLPASGPLTISAIKLEANNTTTYSLNLLSTYCNKATTPNSMSEFYSYGATFQLNAGLATIGFSGQYGTLPQGGFAVCGMTLAGNTNWSIVKLFPNGQVDTSFAQQSTQAMRGCSYSYANDRYYGFGTFGFYGSWSKQYLVCCLPSGVPDTAFNSGGSGLNSNGYVNSMAPLSSGKLIIGGDFTSYNGTGVNRLARLNSNGTLDTSFNSGGGGCDIVVLKVVEDANGKILVGTDGAGSYNGNSFKGIFRVNSDGSWDSTFNSGGAGMSGGGNSCADIAIDSTGKINIVGWFSAWNGTTRGGGYCRLNSNGTLDTGFTPDNGNTADSVVVGGDDLPVLCLRNNNGNGVWRKLTSTGAYNNTFNTSSTTFDTEPNVVVPSINNTYIVLPNISSYAGTSIGGRNICRISATGSLVSYS